MEVNLADLYTESGQTVENSFAEAKRSECRIVPTHPFFNINFFRDHLQDFHTFAPLQFAKSVLNIVQFFAKFADNRFFRNCSLFLLKINVFRADFDENFSEFQISRVDIR